MTSNILRRAVPAAGLLCAVLGSTPAFAQWSTDPAASLVVSDMAGGSTQPKIVPTPDGGFYVSWFSDTGGFDIYLQKLDAAGHALWPSNGVMVADRDYGFTYDYGLAVDAAGNAFVAFNCCASDANQHISISKVEPDGTLAWGAAGISVSNPGSEAVYNAYVTAATDGHLVVAWSADNGVRAQRLDQDGNLLWTSGGIELTQPAAAIKLLGDVEPAEDGNVILSWSNQSGSARLLTAQKLAAADGSVLWGDTAVRVFGQGNLQAGYYPPFIADGAGGAVFYDYDYTGSSFVPRVQHLDSNGNALLGVNGVVATTDTTQDHVSARASYDPATSDIYIVWDDNYTGTDMQSYDGVSAQRIDAAGNLAWGDTGMVLVPPANSTDGTLSIPQLIALPASGGFLAGWVTGSIPAADQPLTIAHLTRTGDYLWPQQTVAVKSLGYTGQVVGTVGATGVAVYAWQDGDDGAGTSTIDAQNLNADGTLGSAVDDRVFADGFDGR